MIKIDQKNISIRMIKWIGVILFIAYVFGMLLYPLFEGGFSWDHLHSVWNNWQALNVGILAFLSSIIAFSISRFNANKQRERNFIAARAFLPEALSELAKYFRSSADLLKEAWDRVDTKSAKSPLTNTVPELPNSYKKVFSRCIQYAEPEVAEFLAYILMRLQIHHSRIEGLGQSFRKNHTMINMSGNIISYLYRLAELQALIGRIFDFARGLNPFDGRNLELADYDNAYSNLSIYPADYDDLIGFTKRAIERERINTDP